MKKLFKLSTIVILLIFLIGIVVLIAVGHGMYSDKGALMKFINSSGQHIASVDLSVSGQSCRVEQLGIGGEFECTFKGLSDGSYAVTVSLQSGPVYSEPSLGYVTGGMNFKDTITINQSGEIELVSSPGT